MRVRANTLFICDARGRILESNDPEKLPAPRLFLGQTANGHVLRFNAAMPDAEVDRIEYIGTRHFNDEELLIPSGCLINIREELELSGSISVETGGLCYRFPDSIAIGEETIEITRSNIEVVKETFRWLYDDLASWQPCCAVIRDGAAVSVCFSSRIGLQAVEAGLFTIPEYRGHGYGTIATAAWGDVVRTTRRIPVYSTSWENVASQGVARRAGLIMFGTDATWI
jgi:GNAT superfamily N-acetyltransferase